MHSLESRGSFRAKRETEPVAAELRIRTSREAVERSSLERSREAGVGEERGEAEDSETRSLASAGSVYGAGGIWPQAPASSSGSVGGTSIGRESMRERSEREKERDRPRQRELREWSQTCWVWTREKSSGGGSGMLGKAPLIREVSLVVRVGGTGLMVARIAGSGGDEAQDGQAGLVAAPLSGGDAQL